MVELKEFLPVAETAKKIMKYEELLKKLQDPTVLADDICKVHDPPIFFNGFKAIIVLTNGSRYIVHRIRKGLWFWNISKLSNKVSYESIGQEYSNTTLRNSIDEILFIANLLDGKELKKTLKNKGWI